MDQKCAGVCGNPQLQQDSANVMVSLLRTASKETIYMWGRSRQPTQRSLRYELSFESTSCLKEIFMVCLLMNVVGVIPDHRQQLVAVAILYLERILVAQSTSQAL